MKRTFNYTGRHRIPLEHISIRVQRDESGERMFDADLRISSLPLPPDGKVYVDAYFERAFRRFEFGTVAAIRPPQDRILAEIDYGRRIQFRVKVVDASGKLLAHADGIRPSDPDDADAGRDPLLPVDPREDMGQEVWRVRFAPEGPLLEVNAALNDVMGLFRNNRVIGALVYPQVLRAVLIRILLSDEESDVDSGWEKRWLDFGAFVSGTPIPDLNQSTRNRDEVENWIGAAVSAFADRVSARDAVRDALREERL